MESKQGRGAKDKKTVNEGLKRNVKINGGVTKYKKGENS